MPQSFRVQIKGVHPQRFMKLVFKIAVDQQTRTCDKTFEGSRTPTAHRARGEATSVFGKFLAQLCQITSDAQNRDNGCSSCSWWSQELIYEWLNYQQKTFYTRNPIVARALGLAVAAFRPSARASKGISHTTKNIYPYLGIRTKFDRFWPINWSSINILNKTNFL